MSLRRWTRSGDRGRLLVIDASCLYEIVAVTPTGEEIRQRVHSDPEVLAPQVVDVEVLSTIRREHMLGRIDRAAASAAVDVLRDWPGRRVSHRSLIARAWELRDNVRTWDAFYVALAEGVGATLVTRDHRLARAVGLRCQIEVV